jgi:hypothetical protein
MRRQRAVEQYAPRLSAVVINEPQVLNTCDAALSNSQKKPGYTRELSDMLMIMLMTII